MLEEASNGNSRNNLYDWFQTNTHVHLNVMIKNLTEDDVKVRLIDDTLDISCTLNDGNECNLHFNLHKPIFVQESSWSVTPSKLEIKLKKLDGKRWQCLEQLPEKTSAKKPSTSSSAMNPEETKPKAFTEKNWDKILKEFEEEEEKEGDKDVNDLFKKIYADADDNTRRAMVKSFSESGGTVLSTNWEEVGKETVPIKPPDGLEFKKYDA
jgi:suppressor of G2 allele of SKP1